MSTKTPSDIRHRKVHSAKILGKQEVEKVKLRWSQDNHYIFIPTFHNNMPFPPCGPYFRPMQLPHSFSDYSTYKYSTLERSFNWKPHLEKNAGIDIDLVDLSKTLIPEKKESDTPLDTRYLQEPKELRRGSNISTNTKWLRKTPLLTNDVYGGTNNFKTGNRIKRDYEQTNEKTNPYDKTYILESFEKANNITKEKLENQRNSTGNTNLKVEWIAPWLPEVDDYEYGLSLFSFDTNPAELPNKRSKMTLGQMNPDRDGDGDTDDIGGVNESTESADHWLVTNIRTPHADESLHSLPQNTCFASLLVKSNAFDSFLTPHQVDCYSWLKDYRVEPKHISTIATQSTPTKQQSSSSKSAGKLYVLDINPHVDVDNESPSESFTPSTLSDCALPTAICHTVVSQYEMYKRPVESDKIDLKFILRTEMAEEDLSKLQAQVEERNTRWAIPTPEEAAAKGRVGAVANSMDEDVSEEEIERGGDATEWNGRRRTVEEVDEEARDLFGDEDEEDEKSASGAATSQKGGIYIRAVSFVALIYHFLLSVVIFLLF